MSESSNKTNVKTLPIVGAFFRPPAQLILENLATDTKLSLIADPENPYDRNAVAVYLDFADIPWNTISAIEDKLQSCGSSIEALAETKTIHVGFIPKEIAAVLRGRGFFSAEGSFQTTSTGKPLVKFVDSSKVVE